MNVFIYLQQRRTVLTSTSVEYGVRAGCIGNLIRDGSKKNE